MAEIAYRAIRAEDVYEGMLADYRRHQVVKRRWARADGEWAVVEDDFVDDWGVAERAEVAESVRACAGDGGLAFGAFDGERLIGFATVGSRRFGSAGQYVQMRQMHVSEEYRGQGVGKRLFRMASDAARARGDVKLYISTQSSVETQGFYRGMGCVDAEEINQALSEAEPYDCQVEYLL